MDLAEYVDPGFVQYPAEHRYFIALRVSLFRNGMILVWRSSPSAVNHPALLECSAPKMTNSFWSMMVGFLSVFPRRYY